MSDFDSATAILTAAADSAVVTPEVTPNEPADSDAPLAPEGTDSAVASPDDATATEDESEKVEPGQSKAPTPKQLTDALKAFREGSPEYVQAAKILQDSYFRSQAYEKLGSIDDIRNIKTQIEAVGGIEGLAELQSTLSSVEETDALLEAGDPRIIDQIIEDSPEGFKKLAPHTLSRLSKLDPEAYSRTVQPHLVRALVDANLPAVLNNLYTMAKDKPEIQGVVRDIMQWFESQKSAAERADRDLLNPDNDRFRTREENLRKEERKLVDQNITSQIDPHVRNELARGLAPYIASINAMPPAQRQDVARATMKGLAEALKADRVYQSQISALMKARKPDVSKIVALNKSKVSQLAPQIIQAIVKGYSLKPGAIKKPGTTTAKPGTKQTSGSTKVMKLQQAPSQNEIAWDHEHMSDTAFIQHRAILTEDAMKRRNLTSRYVSW